MIVSCDVDMQRMFIRSSRVVVTKATGYINQEKIRIHRCYDTTRGIEYYK